MEKIKNLEEALLQKDEKMSQRLAQRQKERDDEILSKGTFFNFLVLLLDQYYYFFVLCCVVSL